MATFNYAASVDSSSANQGIYLGYGLSEIEADDGKTVTLDSSGSTATTPTLSAKLTGAGGFTFTGGSNSVAEIGNSGSDYTGATAVDGLTVKMRAENAFGATSALDLRNGGKVDMDGRTQAVGALTGAAGTEITLGGLTVESGDFAGQLTGSGSLTKTGAGTLTLSGVNDYTGDTTVSIGKLALGSGGSISKSKLVLGSAGIFDISGISADTTTLDGFDVVKGSTLNTAAGKTLALSNTGEGITFDLTGASAGETILAVTGAGGLKITAGANITLSGVVDDGLKSHEAIILATNMAAGSAATTDELSIGRKKFSFSIDTGFNLLATLSSISSFVEATKDSLGPAAFNNVNIRNGGAYLDRLLTQPYAGTPGMEAIEDYFTRIIDTGNLGGTAAVSELRRMFGEYSAYGNLAISTDANRFRQRWRQQNHSSLDNVVFADLLSDAANAGIASDSGLASPVYGVRQSVPAGRSRVWGGGFGSWARQDGRSGLAGYEYDSRGLALGYEYAIDRLRLGFAGAYSRGELEAAELGHTNESDVLNLALHGVYAHESGFYAEGGVGYGHAWNDYRTNMLLGGYKSGTYGSDTFSADLELGLIARLPRGFNLIPSAGVEYDHIRNGSWSERVGGGSAAPANRFAGGREHALDIPVGLRLNKAISLGNGGVIVPEVRAGYVHSANKSAPTIQSGFAGAPGSAAMRGVEPGRNHWRFGAGLSGRVNSRVDFHLEYEFETRSGFRGHNLNASMGVAF